LAAGSGGFARAVRQANALLIYARGRIAASVIKIAGSIGQTGGYANFPAPAMTDTRPASSAPTPAQRIEAELLDSFDEELEMELDAERLVELLLEAPPQGPSPDGRLDRRFYFRELFRLQRELVKLQDWVQDRKLKIVVLFEGRDAAG